MGRLELDVVGARAEDLEVKGAGLAVGAKIVGTEADAMVVERELLVF